MKHLLNSDGDIILTGNIYFDNGAYYSENGGVVDNGQFTLVDIPTVPTEVSMRQARLQLLAYGVLDQVQTVIDSMPSPDKEQAQINWDYAIAVYRTDPLVLAMQQALNLTDEQVDTLFIEASKL